MDAKEFFRLLDAQNNEQHGDLSEFDLEALEGWRLVKDRAKAKEIIDSNVDKKMEELLAEEKETSPLVVGDHPDNYRDKKKRSKNGLYVLSIAASLVLLFGLFFMFKGFNKQENNMAENKETTGKDLQAPAPPLEEKLQETNSDESVVTEKEPAYKAAVNANQPLPLEQSTASKKEADYFSYNTSASDTAVAMPPVMAETAELELKSVTEEKNLDFKKSETQKYRAEETKGKTLGGVTNNPGKKDLAQNEVLATGTYDDIALADKSKLKDSETKKDEDKKVKSRGVLKKQTTNTDVAAGSVAPTVNDQKAPMWTSDSASPKTSVITANTTTNNNKANGEATLTGPGTTTLGATTPVGNVYQWTNPHTTKSTNRVEAQFIGGKAALDAYIKKNLVVPASCASEEVIVIKFHVDEKGAVSKPKIMSKTGHCPDCEKEAIRFVKAMPPWVAATQDGKEVVSYKTITLSFKK
jgi:hypothetical protein